MSTNKTVSIQCEGLTFQFGPEMLIVKGEDVTTDKPFETGISCEAWEQVLQFYYQQGRMPKKP
ncbi:hypothetical protein ES703_38576 [subsurface metagenome]